MEHTQTNYDLVVIGSGAAGHHGAIQAAKLGKKVAVIEREAALGGAAVNTGTIPSKTLREVVMRLSRSRWRASDDQPSVARELAARIEHVAASEGNVFQDQFRRNGVYTIAGKASFLDTHRIRVDNGRSEHVVRGERILIATGTRPAHHPSIPVDGVSITDTDAIRNLPMQRKVLTIVGGGVIGVEYACIAAALGVSVTLIERRHRILEFLDYQIVEALSYHMRSQGVTFRLGEEVDEVSKTADGRVCAVLKSGEHVWSEALLYAVGRQGNTDSLQLENCGLEADARGRITVNGNFQTRQPHIYAAGDVIGFPSLASVSMEQGRVAACHAFGEPVVSVPELFPYGIYSIPEISYVGKSEEQLTQESVPYEIGIAHYREIARGQILNDTTGLLKILFHRQTRRLLGVHIVGEGATELIHIGQSVLGFEGAIDFLVNTVFNYPTLAECYKVAALNGLNRLNFGGVDAITQRLPSESMSVVA
ncbi:MAG: Si-specific NAD(P)(+) transhydrogenase [Acidobacteria bacterium]|nr:Si-specific NAD(P)(+) transhydrogenase [Acidobacteriota bacterium]